MGSWSKPEEYETMTSSMLLEGLPPVQGMAAAVDVDITALIASGVFLFMLIVLKFTLIDPYLKIVEERENRTEGAREGADDLQQQAKDTLLAYEDRLAAARREAMDQRTALRASAESKRETQVAQARDTAASLLADRRVKIEEQTKVANEAIEREAQSLSQTIVSRVLNTGA